jgi:hypothetical protein
MVIGDDEIDAALFGDLSGFYGGDAAVDGDDELGAAVDDLAEGVGIEAVAFFEAVGDVEVDFAAQDVDGVPEDGGGGDAVDVVVAVDDDFFAVADGAGDAVGGFGEVGNGGGVVEIIGAGGEKGLAGLGIAQAAVEQRLGEHGGGFEPRGQFVGLGVGGNQIPLLGMHPCHLD